MHAVSPRSRLVLAGAAVAVVVAAGVTAFVATRPAALTLTVHFVEAPGLYPGNNVDILGVPIGRVTRITPGAEDVAVELSLPHDTRLPANAEAVLLSPNVASDRFVALSPPYTGGPLLQSGASIPVSRTHTPVEVDEVFKAIDDLAKALGPNGVDKDGSVGDALHVVAQNVAGNGQRLHDTVAALARALPALSSNAKQLTGLLTNVDTLTRALADHNATVSAFYADLATATSQLAGEREDLATALASLQTALGQLGTFVQSNRATIGASVRNLITVTNALLAHQRELIETFDVAPLAIANLGATFDGSDPTNNRARVRASLQPGQVALINQYCGQSSLPHVTALGLQPVAGLLGPVLGTSTSTGTPWDLLCVTLDAVLQEPPAPGAPQIPDLGVARFLAGT
jgi:virulence factor Mce-like protein